MLFLEESRRIAVMQNLPDRLDLLLACWLGLANEHVFCLFRAPWDLQEFIKLQHPPLTTRPSFAALVEDRLAWVMNTFFLVPGSSTRVSSTAASPATRCICGDLQLRIVRVGLFYWRFRRGRRRCNGGGDSRALRELAFDGNRRRRRLGDLGRFGSRRVIDR